MPGFRFRPRFSVRTLAVFVTLVCVYFGGWEATKKYGVPMIIQQEPEAKEVLALGPFVVRYTWMSGIWFKGYRDHRNYYIWFFGRLWKLSLESSTPVGWKEHQESHRRYQEQLRKHSRRLRSHLDR